MHDADGPFVFSGSTSATPRADAYAAPEGAESAFSTYGHLIDCYLEIQADRALIGPQRTDAVIRDKGHYTWNYKTVVEDEKKIAGVVRRHGLEVK